MYLKKLQLNNFRKFSDKNNIVEFVDTEIDQNQNEGGNIDISSITTLIVGKNNSGKTTITKALEKLIKGNNFEANDFNFSYLKKKLNDYEKQIRDERVKEDGNINSINVKPPLIEFKLTIGIQDVNNDLVTNLVPFMTLDNVDKSELEITVKYELAEKETFQHDVILLFSEGKTDEEKRELNDTNRFRKFLELIEHSTDFKTRYYSASGDNVQFKMEDLIEITSIKANNVDDDRCLSRAFSKIIEYRYKSGLDQDNIKALDSTIEEINSQLSQDIANENTDSINESLGSIVNSDKLKMFLRTDLTLKKLMTNLIKYEYVEEGYNIPETQFGLGYTNLMMIIAELIEYMEKYPEQSFNSKVNLISIEEPETFMHPQMQELFIKHINGAITKLLSSNHKHINSQLIITTHSSHILNSKIHSGNTFNNINYITTENKSSHVVALNDENIMPTTEVNKGKEKQDRENDLKFIKKHIKYKVSELFFSDAIIFVEGITEETLIRYYIDTNKTLSKFYISIFNIGGAHALVYHELIKKLKVPTLIITDLDIKRTLEEKEDAKKGVFTQITTLKNRETTNNTIKKYNDNKYSIEELEMASIDTHVDNLKLSYQGMINGFYATSFEEAYILTNFKNDILKKAIGKLKQKFLEGIIGKEEDVEQIKENSYKFQRELSGSKSAFANKLLYEFIIAAKSVELPVLPKYILEGLTWLSEKLTGGTEK